MGLYVENVNSNPQMGLPGTNINNVAKGIGAAPAFSRLTDGHGIIFTGIPAAGRLLLPLTDLEDPMTAGVLAIQAKGAVTVQITMSPRQFVMRDKGIVDTGVVLPNPAAAHWVAFTVAADNLVELPVGATGIYITGTAGTAITLRRA